MQTPRRSPAERLQAWLVTGPLGHLWSVLADLGVLFARRLRDKLRPDISTQRRLAGAGRRPSERR